MVETSFSDGAAICEDFNKPLRFRQMSLRRNDPSGPQKWSINKREFFFVQWFK